MPEDGGEGGADISPLPHQYHVRKLPLLVRQVGVRGQKARGSGDGVQRRPGEPRGLWGRNHASLLCPPGPTFHFIPSHYISHTQT